MRKGDLPQSLEHRRMLNTDQMASALNYSTEHLRRIVRQGRFPKPVRIGRFLLWPASVLTDLAGGNPEKAA